MNRRRFFELLGQATIGGMVVYSFPSIIIPKNIVIPVTGYNLTPRGLTFLLDDKTRILQGVTTAMWQIPIEYAVPIIGEKPIPPDFAKWLGQ